MTRLWEAEGIGIDSESKSFSGFCPVEPEVGNLKGDLLEVLSVLFIFPPENHSIFESNIRQTQN